MATQRGPRQVDIIMSGDVVVILTAIGVLFIALTLRLRHCLHHLAPGYLNTPGSGRGRRYGSSPPSAPSARRRAAIVARWPLS